ncbi:intraflagellar transport protein 122 [Echinococcus multilocularis]|uniref:Intraflagellar transport protein 122 n=1 Tax=Echinococcus multilocularis TaxID=6211 RepID=A0A068Y7B3_ECHMU|nr:intraflagellar transport protein 122 [Echinococcus multilocularis]
MRESGAQSFAWNQINNNLLCYCNNGTLYVVVDDCVCHQQPMEGIVISFNGASVYCISERTVRSVDVQLAQAMYYYLSAGRLQEAYRIACLGVAESDWRELGKVALLSMELQIAQSAFIQLGDYFYLTYIQQLNAYRRRGAVQEPASTLAPTETLLIEAELACYQGNYNEAVKAFKKANHLDRVLGLYVDLRRFAEAKEALVLAAGDGRAHFDQKSQDATRFLLTKHAEWARTTKDYRAAAVMFIEVGDFAAAAELAVEHGWVDVLLEISRKIDKGDRISLDLCAKKLAHFGEYAFAADCYARMGDIGSQVDILIKAGKWNELLSLVQEYPEFTRRVYLPYAQWLAENDDFEEAQAAFAQAGLAKEAVNFLEELASCAVFESRFNDASWYYWKLSRQCAEVAKKADDMRAKRNNLKRFEVFSKLADLYYVYNNIHQYMNDPFAAHMPEAYLNMARYLLNRMGKDEIEGISKVNILCTLAKNSSTLHAFKLARCAFDRLQTLRIKEPLRRIVELQTLAIRATPLQDSEDVTIVCYRCSNTTSMLQSDNRCINCKAPFIYSFLSFDILPLVEFIPDPELTEEEVAECIRIDSPARREAVPEGLSCDDKALDAERDVFAEKLVNFNLGSDKYQPVVLDAKSLRAIPSSEIIILDPGYPMRKLFFKNVLPEVGVTCCKSCNKLFQKEDYQVLLLQKHQCPFCRCGADG